MLTTDLPPWPTVLPLALTPPLIDTLCCSPDGLVIVIVTLPALAASVLLSNFSGGGSAEICSCVPPPPPLAAVEPPLLVLDELPDEPQPATTSRIVALRMRSRFMRGTLARSGDQELQQRLLSMQPVLGLVPDRGAVAVEHVGADLLAG